MSKPKIGTYDAVKIPSTMHLHEALEIEGYPLPENTLTAQLVMNVDSMFVIQFDVALDQNKLDKLGRALQRIAKETT